MIILSSQTQSFKDLYEELYILVNCPKKTILEIGCSMQLSLRDKPFINEGISVIKS